MKFFLQNLRLNILLEIFFFEEMDYEKGAITITFGEQVENGVNMEKIGSIHKRGFLVEELEEAAEKFRNKGYEVICFSLNELLPKSLREQSENANVLVVRDGLREFANPDNLFKEHISLSWDKKKLERGVVKNSQARYNLCYSDYSQEPDYEHGKGRVYSFEELPHLKKVREGLPKFLGKKAYNLHAEGNYYYDVSLKKEGKCGIGWHGDAERKIVIGGRLGPGFPIEWNWYHRFNPVGIRFHLELYHGDFYVMSEKTTGFDWKKSSILTLRHAAGNKKKYLDANGEAIEYITF